MLSDWMLRLRALFKRAAVEDDIDAELRFHLDQQVQAHLARGLDRDRGEAASATRIRRSRSGQRGISRRPWRPRHRPVASRCTVLTSVTPGDANGNGRCRLVARLGDRRECRDLLDHQQPAASHAAGEGSSTTRPDHRHALARAKLELSDLVGDSEEASICSRTRPRGRLRASTSVPEVRRSSSTACGSAGRISRRLV